MNEAWVTFAPEIIKRLICENYFRVHGWCRGWDAPLKGALSALRKTPFSKNPAIGTHSTSVRTLAR